MSLIADRGVAFNRRRKSFRVILAAAVAALTVALISARGLADGEDGMKKKKKAEQPKESVAKDKSAAPSNAPKPIIRWGKRRKETDAEYDKRYAVILKKVKKDSVDDRSGGLTPLYTLMPQTGLPFVVRSDIDEEFTAQTAMYMEMLHREYSAAYNKLLGVPSRIKEPIEVVVYEDRNTYMQAGGMAGSGGQFEQNIFRGRDRGHFWPAIHFRLSQFTSGIKDFSKWEKGTLKHEAAHMELQMRLGIAVDSPRWWNEGHATVFEYWDFEKTVDENLAEIPNRGRYAPFIRRIFGTDKWKDFHYVWTIDASKWAHDMTGLQGYLNYCQAWSLAGYMMSGGKKGITDFRKIYELSLRVGADRAVSRTGKKTMAWEDAFPEKDRKVLEQNWEAWVKENVPRDKTVPDEAYFLRRSGAKVEVTDKLETYSEEEFKKIRETFDKEDKGRREDPTRVEK